MGFAKMCGPGRTLEILLSKHKFKSHIGDYSKVLQTLQMLVLASKFDIEQCDRGGGGVFLIKHLMFRFLVLRKGHEIQRKKENLAPKKA